MKPTAPNGTQEKIYKVSQFSTLDELINEISQKNHINQKILQLCQRDLSSVYKKFKQNKMKEKEILNWVTSKQYKLKSMKDYPTDQSDEFLVDVFVILMKGAEIAFGGKIPRFHQMICLWLNVHLCKTILEVKTGEGKTMIASLTALYFALRGKKVDVFTSSAALAMTETQPKSSVSKLFALFKISLGDVCRKRTGNTQKVYQNQVIYGTSFEFQADYLQKFFLGNHGFFKERNFDSNHVAILDEVDAVLIDRMRDSTRLSSEKPLFECIKAILILINEVKIKLRQAKGQFCGSLSVKILGEVIKFDKKVNQSNNFDDSEQYIKEQKQQVLQIVRAAVQTKIRYMFPNYLLEGSDSYINIMLPLWIDSSYQARNYEKDVHYIVSKKTHEIIPIDISTGTYQKKTKWMNGVHQFVELQYGFAPSVDTIVTNYESNLIFFRRYDHYLYGMTGTISESIGKSDDLPSIFEKFLTDNYKVKIYKIPTAKKRLLTFEYPKLYAVRSQWMRALYRDSKKYSQKRMVLIIFNTIKEAKDFVENFPKQKGYKLKELYDHDNYHKSLQQRFDIQKTIIVSTNLGGRGTDIEISNQSILDNGGLHVMMTYFAPNWRIEEQAFGRAGRNGQPGSGSFYLNIDQPLAKGKKLEQDQQNCRKLFKLMANQRKSYQKIEFEDSKISIENLKRKSQLLDQFYKHYLKQAHKKTQYLNQIIESKQRIIQKCRPQLIQYYETLMECNFAQEQWGIFLRRKQFDQNKNKGKETELAIDFKEFVRQYRRNRRNNDVNPGFFAICGSQLFEVSPQRSEALIDLALTKNDKSWVNKYYKIYFRLKKYSGSQIKVSIASSLIDDLRSICQIILYQFSLQMAMTSPIDLPKEKKKQLSNLKLFYIDLMSNLQAISQSLKKYVINDKKRMKMFCEMKRNKKNIASLIAKGLNHLITDFQMIEFKQEKQEPGGIFSGIWSLIKTVFMGVVSLIVSTVAVVVTPIIAVCGGGNISKKAWQGVDKLWNKTGECWQDTIKRLPEIAVAGLSLLAIYFANGLAIAAILPLIAWVYLRTGETITLSNSVPLKKGLAEGVLPLVEIAGTCRLNSQAQKKIDILRTKCEEKYKEINQYYETIYNILKKWNPSSHIDAEQIKQMERTAFSKNKPSKLEQSQPPNAFKQQNAQEMTKILNKKKTIEKVNIELSNIRLTKKSVLETAQQIGSSFLKNTISTYEKNSQIQREKLNKKIEQGTAIQLDIDIFSSNAQLAEPQIQKLGAKITELINNNVTISKVSEISNPSGIASQIKIPYVSEVVVQSTITKVQEQMQKIVNLNQQENQTQQIFGSQRILNNPLYIQTSQIKNQNIGYIIKDLKEQYVNEVRKKIENKQKMEIKQTQQEYVKKIEQIQLDVFEKIQKNCERLRVSPIVDANKINEPQYYEQTAYWKCKSQSVTFFTVESQQEFIGKLKQNKGKQMVIQFQKAVLYQTQQETLLKLYQQKNQNNNLLIKAIEEGNKIQKLVFADEDGCSKCGNAIISDLNKFIYQEPIQDESQMIISHEMKKEYLKSLILQQIVNHFSGQKYAAIKKQREEMKPSLPAHFMPFQMKKQEFQTFGYEVSDIICKTFLKTEDDFRIYRQLVQSVRLQVAMDQEKEIKQKYPELSHLLGQQQKKKPARR